MEFLDNLFNTVEITINNCPDGLEGAEVQYEDADLVVVGIVKNGKLIVESVDIPENVSITWGEGRWTISWQ